MGNIKAAMQLGGAFVGVIVGAGFASGQEIMQFFTSFGVMGLLGAVVASALFVFLATVYRTHFKTPAAAQHPHTGA